MYNLEVSDRAEQDLDNIISYIKDKLFAPKAAVDFADAVYDCYDHLEENPYIYSLCNDPNLQKEDYRRAIINNYILVFKIYEETKKVIAHRFFYGGQNYVDLI